jgi:hypothetical protein
MDSTDPRIANIWCHLGRTPLFLRDDSSRELLAEIASELVEVANVAGGDQLLATLRRLPLQTGPATVGFIYRGADAQLRVEVSVDPSLSNEAKLAALSDLLRTFGAGHDLGFLADAIEPHLFVGVGLSVTGQHMVSLQFAAKSGGILPWLVAHRIRLGLSGEFLTNLGAWQQENERTKRHELESRRVEAVKFDWTSGKLGDAKLYLTAVSPSNAAPLPTDA